MIHKVLIIGDSHMRSCTANVKSSMLNVKSSIKDNLEVQGVVKPGAVTNILVNSAKNEVKGLSKKDMVVICGGANDIGKNNSTMALHQIRDFIANNTHTNIALITAPPRQSSCVNSAVTSFNRKVKKLVKAHHHASLLEIDTNRNLHTTHGLHLNGQGKERLANQIVFHILSVLE
jgi:lysophospholipase L1-like esterase